MGKSSQDVERPTELVSNAECISDSRGAIQNLKVGGKYGVAIITGKKGSVRSNHYHQYGRHTLVVLEGRVRYQERERANRANEISRQLYPGDAILTRPGVVHRVEFLEDSTLVSVQPGFSPTEYAADTMGELF